MKKYLVVGSTSFIGQYLNRNTFDKISYKDLHDNDLSKYHAVVNCALDPKYKTSEYDEEYDFDDIKNSIFSVFKSILFL